MIVWLQAGLIAAFPFVPWSRFWKWLLSKFNTAVPEAKKDIEFKLKQSQIDSKWMSYENIILFFVVTQGLIILSWFTDVLSWMGNMRFGLGILSVAPWYFIKWWGNHVKSTVRTELADFYRAFRQLLLSGAKPDQALQASMEHVKYMRKQLQNILDNWGDPVGTRETLATIYDLYKDSDIKNMINLLEGVLLNPSDELTLETIKSQETLIRDLQENIEESRDEAEKDRLETMSTLVILAQVFMVILPVVTDTVSQMKNINN